jgi:hypothetical protein
MAIRPFLITAIVMLMATSLSTAQPPIAPTQQAMKKLDFLVGQWKGEGWLEFAPGQRRTFKGVEIVQLKLDGLILTIDGMHRGQVGGNGEEGVVHNAFALVTYDDKNKRYRFQGFTARGNHEDTEAKVTNGQIVWGMKIPQFGDVRYVIKLDDKGRWFEIGEVSQDGKEPRRFFEMTLARVETK